MACMFNRNLFICQKKGKNKEKEQKRMNVRMDEQIMSVDQKRLQMKVEQIINKCKNKTANETSKQALT